MSVAFGSILNRLKAPDFGSWCVNNVTRNANMSQMTVQSSLGHLFIIIYLYICKKTLFGCCQMNEKAKQQRNAARKEAQTYRRKVQAEVTKLTNVLRPWLDAVLLSLAFVAVCP